MPRELDNKTNLETGSDYPAVQSPAFDSSLTPVGQTIFLTTAATSINTYLPSATQATGVTYRFIKTNTDFVNIAYVWPSGSETISGRSSISLLTIDETFIITSDGSNWVILEHMTATDWIDMGTITITGTTSDPTKSTSMTRDKWLIKRQGSNLLINMQYRPTNATGALAGSGDYLLTVCPPGLTINSSFNTFTTIVGANKWEATTQALGQGYISSSPGGNGIGIFVAYNTTKVRLLVYAVTTNGAFSSSLFPLNATNVAFTGELSVPINEFIE